MASVAATDPMLRATEIEDPRPSGTRFSLVAGASGIVFVGLLVGPLFAFGLAPSPTSRSW